MALKEDWKGTGKRLGEAFSGLGKTLIKTAKMSYSFENTMYGTLGPERTVWDEEANEAMQETVKKNMNN